MELAPDTKIGADHEPILIARTGPIEAGGVAAIGAERRPQTAQHCSDLAAAAIAKPGADKLEGMLPKVDAGIVDAENVTADALNLALAACKELDQVVREVGLVYTDPHVDPHCRSSIRPCAVALLPDLKLRLIGATFNHPIVRSALRSGLLGVSARPMTTIRDPYRPVDPEAGRSRGPTAPPAFGS